MKIKNIKDIIKFCEKSRKIFPSSIKLVNKLSPEEIYDWEKRLNEHIFISKDFHKINHLQQGIDDMYISSDKEIILTERPFLYPSQLNINKNCELLGPMTGVLVNCYDPKNKLFLFQLRGGQIYSPFSFQAGAAGMGYFTKHPSVNAQKELFEEAGLDYAQILFNGKAVDTLPFTLTSEKIPQLFLVLDFKMIYLDSSIVEI